MPSTCRRSTGATSTGRGASYLDEVIAWEEEVHRRWMLNLDALDDDDIDPARRLHWGAEVPLSRVVTIIATHLVYHAGELNQLLSIFKGEAWEETEEVEENHISTIGHRVRPPWMNAPSP